MAEHLITMQKDCKANSFYSLYLIAGGKYNVSTSKIWWQRLFLRTHKVCEIIQCVLHRNILFSVSYKLQKIVLSWISVLPFVFHFRLSLLLRQYFTNKIALHFFPLRIHEYVSTFHYSAFSLLFQFNLIFNLKVVFNLLHTEHLYMVYLFA